MDTRALLAADGASIAYRLRPGRGPTLLWLGGFASDMDGQKAAALDNLALQEGLAFLRFDYFGHGCSSGAFADGTVNRWLADALEVADRLTEGDLLPIGSSMGAWIAVHLALKRPARVRGLVLIAPALDFTGRLLEPSLPQEAKAALLADGRWVRHSAYTADGLVVSSRMDAHSSFCPGPSSSPALFVFSRAAPIPTCLGATRSPRPWRSAARTSLSSSFGTATTDCPDQATLAVSGGRSSSSSARSPRPGAQGAPAPSRERSDRDPCVSEPWRG